MDVLVKGALCTVWKEWRLQSVKMAFYSVWYVTCDECKRSNSKMQCLKGNVRDGTILGCGHAPLHTHQAYDKVQNHLFVLKWSRDASLVCADRSKFLLKMFVLWETWPLTQSSRSAQNSKSTTWVSSSGIWLCTVVRINRISLCIYYCLVKCLTWCVAFVLWKKVF